MEMSSLEKDKKEQITTTENQGREDSQVLVRHIPSKMSNHELAEYMSMFGHVAEAQIAYKKDKSLGYGFVTFYSQEIASRVISFGSIIVGDAQMVFEKVDNPDVVIQRRAEIQRRKVFIKGLCKEAEEDHLFQHFNQFGEVESIMLNRYFNGKSKRTAFVVFKSEEQTKSILSDSSIKHIILKRRVRLFEALSKNDIASFIQSSSHHGNSTFDNKQNFSNLDEPKFPYDASQMGSSLNSNLKEGLSMKRNHQANPLSSKHPLEFESCKLKIEYSNSSYEVEPAALPVKFPKMQATQQHRNESHNSPKLYKGRIPANTNPQMKPLSSKIKKKGETSISNTFASEILQNNKRMVKQTITNTIDMNSPHRFLNSEGKLVREETQNTKKMMSLNNKEVLMWPTEATMNNFKDFNSSKMKPILGTSNKDQTESPSKRRSLKPISEKKICCGCRLQLNSPDGSTWNQDQKRLECDICRRYRFNLGYISKYIKLFLRKHHVDSLHLT